MVLSRRPVLRLDEVRRFLRLTRSSAMRGARRLPLTAINAMTESIFTRSSRGSASSLYQPSTLWRLVTAGLYADAIHGWQPLVIFNRYVLGAVVSEH
jgi:hypothetical protein